MSSAVCRPAAPTKCSLRRGQTHFQAISHHVSSSSLSLSLSHLLTFHAALLAFSSFRSRFRYQRTAAGRREGGGEKNRPPSFHLLSRDSLPPFHPVPLSSPAPMPFPPFPSLSIAFDNIIAAPFPPLPLSRGRNRRPNEREGGRNREEEEPPGH